MADTHLYHIGKMIKTIMEDKQITTGMLSAQTGIDWNFIEQVKNGERDISVNQLVKIANALNCYIDVNITPVR